MKNIKPLVIIWLVFFPASLLKAQQDFGCHVRISVLTCSPGSQLYEIWGHTALRVTDSAGQNDIVYSWGTFDFDAPGFYRKFVRGSQEFFLASGSYSDFLDEYQLLQRSIWEQELNLSCAQKQKLLLAVHDNLKEDKRFYIYDFLFDNCTTRVRDILFKNINGLAVTDSLVESGITFRNQIHEYLDEGAKPWSKLGIDILLGSKMDKAVTNYEAMFLPDYLMQGLDESNLQEEGLIGPSTIIFKANPPDVRAWKYAPLLVLSIFSGLIFTISLLRKKWALTVTHFFDSFMFYLTGVLGLVLLLMWFGTDHIECKNNWNLIWALPTNLMAAFFIFKKPWWIKKYFTAAAVVYVLLLLTWFWLPQQMNFALIPVVLYLLLRCVKLASGKMSS